MDNKIRCRRLEWLRIMIFLTVCTIVLTFVYGLASSIFESFCVEKVHGRKLKETVINGVNHNLRTTKHLTGQGQVQPDTVMFPEPMKRAQHLHEVCTRLEDLGQVPIELPRHTYEYMYVNDQYRFIFCMMPKLACTNWKRVFLALNDHFPNKDFVMNDMHSSNVHGLHGQYGKTLVNYSPSEIKYRLQTYKKIIFVRDPFERILSAYRDKMFRNDSQSYINMARKIKDLKRKNDTSQDVNVKFLEFVQYLTDPDTFESSYEQHWAKYSHLCEPCVVQYDFIGKFETMDADIKLAFKYMEIDGILKFPHRNASYSNTKSSDIVLDYYKQIPDFYLQKLYQLFKVDFLLFSYSLPDIGSNFLK